MIIDYLKKYEKESIVGSLILIAVAIFLIAKPGIALTTAVTIFGIIFLVEGIIGIISYMREEPEVRAFSSELMMGILLAMLGLIILFNRTLFISMIPIITGIWIIIRSIMKFQFAINLKSVVAEKWGWMLVSSIVMCILGILIIVNPFEAIVTLTRFIGIMIVIAEVIDIFESIYFLAKAK